MDKGEVQSKLLFRISQLIAWLPTGLIGSCKEQFEQDWITV